MRDVYKRQVIDIVLYIFRTLRFDNYTAQISLRDPENKEKYIGSAENWEKAESAIIEAARAKGLKTVVEYGEAAFYGPKLDFMVDVYKRQIEGRALSVTARRNISQEDRSTVLVLECAGMTASLSVVLGIDKLKLYCSFACKETSLSIIKLISTPIISNR